jgi:hypothetical protein
MSMEIVQNLKRNLVSWRSKRLLHLCRNVFGPIPYLFSCKNYFVLTLKSDLDLDLYESVFVWLPGSGSALMLKAHPDPH